MAVDGTNYQNHWCNGKTFHENKIKPLNHKPDNTGREAEEGGRWSKDCWMRQKLRGVVWWPWQE